MCDLDDRDKINTGANLVFARALEGKGREYDENDCVYSWLYE